MVVSIPPKPDFMTQEAWDAQMAGRSPEAQREFTRMQIKAIRNGGWVGNDRAQGAAVCLVSTIGRKSGEVKTTALIYYKRKPDDKCLYVVGSTAGLDRHPLWALNLEAKPEAVVELPGEKWDAEVHLLSKEEKSSMWEEMTRYFPLWGHFQKYCDRDFMVFRLSPKP